ncbi:MAG: type II toxin-antitoxin system RelE/ParE family toxin [Coriobacteriia bacterium]|nr:type II toxin-antitoxin system RelE/ParE family toxin [Coriobacteriia bacterium]
MTASPEIDQTAASRPIPSIGRRCHESRVVDEDSTWRVVYRLDSDADIIADVFKKKTQATPKAVIEACKRFSCPLRRDH